VFSQRSESDHPVQAGAGDILHQPLGIPTGTTGDWDNCATHSGPVESFVLPDARLMDILSACGCCLTFSHRYATTTTRKKGRCLCNAKDFPSN